MRVKDILVGLYDPLKISECDLILKILKKLPENYTLLAICPNSNAVLKAAVQASKKNNSPLIFAATLNQIDTDGGYTGLNFKAFLKSLNFQIACNNYKGICIVGLDHGGPWLKDKQSIENWELKKCIKAIKKSFEGAISAGYNLLHIDPTVDKSLSKGHIISIETVVDRTVELILYCENFRNKKKLPKISYEVGTEEVNGGISDTKIFEKFLKLLKLELGKHSSLNVFPCFIVGKVGTELNTRYFDTEIAKELVSSATKYGAFIKGHYTDYVENLYDYPKIGIAGANIGPELTEVEYDTLMELVNKENNIFKKGKITEVSNLDLVIYKTVKDSNRWRKWLDLKELNLEFDSLSEERKNWLLRTGSRYIWTNPEVVEARNLLQRNLLKENLKSEDIVIKSIIKTIDRYIKEFNLINLNFKIKNSIMEV